MSTITSFIDKISKVREQELVSVTIPSTQSVERFMPLNVKQQKSLLKHTIDGPAGAVGALNELHNIIIENCINKSAEFSSIDKYPILIALRTQCLGDSVTIANKKYSLKRLPQDVGFVPSDFTGNILYNTINVTLETPSLIKDSDFLVKTISDIAKVEDHKLTETITTMYIYEIAKFIKTIEFDDSVIDFTSLTNSDKKTVVNNLPMKLNQQILAFIGNIRDKENKFITFDDGVILPINTLFFSTD